MIVFLLILQSAVQAIPFDSPHDALSRRFLLLSDFARLKRALSKKPYSKDELKDTRVFNSHSELGKIPPNQSFLRRPTHKYTFHSDHPFIYGARSREKLKRLTTYIYPITTTRSPAKTRRPEWRGLSRTAKREGDLGIWTKSSGTFHQREVLRMIVDERLKKNKEAKDHEIVHVTGVYKNPNVVHSDRSTSLGRTRLPLKTTTPTSFIEERIGSNHIRIQVVPSPQINEVADEFIEDDNDITSTSSEVHVPAVPPHAPATFLPKPPKPNIHSLSPFAKSKLLRFAHMQRTRTNRENPMLPSLFADESLSCRYCFIYWTRQLIQPRDIFEFCCRSDHLSKHDMPFLYSY